MLIKVVDKLGLSTRQPGGRIYEGTFEAVRRAGTMQIGWATVDAGDAGSLTFPALVFSDGGVRTATDWQAPWASYQLDLADPADVAGIKWMTPTGRDFACPPAFLTA